MDLRIMADQHHGTYVRADAAQHPQHFARTHMIECVLVDHPRLDLQFRQDQCQRVAGAPRRRAKHEARIDAMLRDGSAHDRGIGDAPRVERPVLIWKRWADPARFRVTEKTEREHELTGLVWRGRRSAPLLPRPVTELARW